MSVLLRPSRLLYKARAGPRSWDWRRMSGIPGLSFIRGTPAGGNFNIAGTMVFAGAATPVFDHDPALGNKPLGYRAFPQYINRPTQSQDFNHGDWAQTGAGSVVPNTDVALDGTTTADTLTDSDAGNLTRWSQVFATGVANNDIFTASLAFKKDSDQTRFPAITITYAAGGALINILHVNTETGAVTFRSSGSPAPVGRALDWGDYWGAILTADNDGSGNTQLTLSARPSDGPVFGVGDVAAMGSVIAWGMSLTETPYWVPYVPTTTSAVTVDGDVLSGTHRVDGEGTFVAAARSSLGVSSQDQVVIRVDDGTANNLISLARTSTRKAQAQINGGGAGVVTATSVGEWSDGVDARMAMSWSQAAGKVQISLDRAPVVEAAWTDAFSAVVNQLQVGHRGGTNQLAGTIAAFEHWPVARFDGDLRAA